MQCAFTGARQFFREQWLGGEFQIQDTFRYANAYVHAGVAVRPLGVAVGIPAVAGAVGFAASLDAKFPEFAQQVRRPESLLLAPENRPFVVIQFVSFLDVSCGGLVAASVKVGLQKLAPSKRVAAIWAANSSCELLPCQKNKAEDRMISVCNPTDDLVCLPKLPRPQFARISFLRSFICHKHLKLKICKRDARHYFHNLKLGKRWHRVLSSCVHCPIMSTYLSNSFISSSFVIKCAGSSGPLTFENVTFLLAATS